MKLLALFAVATSAAYYCYLQHPELLPKKYRSTTTLTIRPTPSVAPKPTLHYHSPLDASNSRSSSGYFSAEPSERYETTGQRATASGRAALLNPPAEDSP